MSAADNYLSETDIRSRRAKAWIVRADAGDARSWLADAPVCPLLAHYHIRHTAVAHMPAPFKIVRPQLGGSYFLACFGGEGRVLVDGRWLRCRKGHAVLLPPGTLHAFHTPVGKVWDFCWVRYQERAGQKPLASVQTPVIAVRPRAAAAGDPGPAWRVPRRERARGARIVDAARASLCGPLRRAGRARRAFVAIVGSRSPFARPRLDSGGHVARNAFGREATAAALPAATRPHAAAAAHLAAPCAAPPTCSPSARPRSKPSPPEWATGTRSYSPPPSSASWAGRRRNIRGGDRTWQS